MHSKDAARYIFIPLLFFLLTSTTLAGVTVEPAIAASNQGDIKYTFTVTNDDNEAETIFFLFPTASSSSSTDPFEVTAGTVEHPNGWTVERIISRGGGDEKDTVVLTGNNGESIGTDETIQINITPERNAVGGYPFDVNLSNNDVYSQNIFIDGKSPTVTAYQPTAMNLTQMEQTIRVEYTDGDGIGVDEDNVRILVNDNKLSSNKAENLLEATANQTVLTEGQNNASLYLVDDYGYQRWHNWTFGLAVDPILDQQTPTGIVNDQSPQIKLRYRDPSPIDASGTTIEINDRTHGNDDSEFSIDDDNDATQIQYNIPYSLDDGEHDITATASDNKGNSASLSWRFTVDTTPPDIDSISVSNGDIYQEDMPVFIEASDDTTSVDRIEIQVGDETETISEEIQDEYRGRIDTTELTDGEHTLSVTVYDTADNSFEETYDITIDNNPPTIEYLNLFPNPTNVPPQLELVGDDIATNVIAAEYFIGSDPGEGNAEPMNIESRDGRETTFTDSIDITDLEDGTYELHVRVKDNVQHWSDVEENSFHINRSLQASLQFDNPPSIHIRQGTSNRAALEIQNTGKVPGTANLSASSPFQTQVTQNNRIIRPGEARVFYVNISVPANTELGNRTLNLTARTEATLTNTSLPLVIKANQQTRQTIENNLAGLKDDINTLHQRHNKWSKQVDKGIIENVSAKITSINNSLGSIKTAISKNNYYQAKQSIDELPASVHTTEQTLHKGIEEYKDARNHRNIILAIVAILIATGIVTWYWYRPLPTEENENQRFTAEEDNRPPLHVRGEELLYRLQEQIERWIQQLRQQMTDINTQRQTSQKDEKEGWGGYNPDS